MEKKSILNKIAGLFTTEVEETISFVDVKTMDNKILRVSDMAIEGTVEEIQEDATLIPVEDGDYVLEDGVVISVAAGVITEISTPEEEAADTEEEMAPTEVAVEEMEVAEETFEEEVVESAEELEFINSLKEMIADVKELKEKFNSIEKENIELKEEVAKFSKAPSVTETSTQVNFSTNKKENNGLMYNLLLNNKKK